MAKHKLANYEKYHHLLPTMIVEKTRKCENCETVKRSSAGIVLVTLRIQLGRLSVQGLVTPRASQTSLDIFQYIF